MDGIDADWQKKSTPLILEMANLNPIGDRKFLFSIDTNCSRLGNVSFAVSFDIGYFQPTVPADFTQGKGLLWSLPLGGAGGFLKLR